MRTRPKTLLVDMGGVLIDFAGGRGLPIGRADWRGREALLHFISERGARLSFGELEDVLFEEWRVGYRHRSERGHEERWDRHLKRLRRRAGIKTHSLVLLRTWFRPFAEQLRPLPRVRPTLAELARRGHAMAVISNVPLPGRLYREVLERTGLAEFFRGFFFSYDQGSRKPSPAMLRSALAALDSPPSEAVMIGDRRSVDIVAGRAAGTGTVWVQSEDDLGPQPDFVIDELSGLLTVV
jgi:putative hydrolase of the HAD superfamily